FTVRLSTPPTADVVIPVFNQDTTEWRVDHDTLRFTSANWQIAQSVTVTGVDDSAVDGDITGFIVLGPIQSADARYASLDPKDVAAVNRDDDAKAVVVLVPVPALRLELLILLMLGMLVLAVLPQRR
ncbi:MAG: hypothetical protein L0H70_04270, partial [Xanthomonadales bacterium]|nr:hypothetical protein [Xanthomonadales bacterium]